MAVGPALAPQEPSPASLDHLNQLSFVQMSTGAHGETTAIEMDGALARAVAEGMHVLASPRRVWILSRLKDGPCSVGELAEAVSMEASVVSHQLRQLCHLGLVIGERRGKPVIYGMHDLHVAELLDQTGFHVEHAGVGRPGMPRNTFLAWKALGAIASTCTATLGASGDRRRRARPAVSQAWDDRPCRRCTHADHRDGRSCSTSTVDPSPTEEAAHLRMRVQLRDIGPREPNKRRLLGVPVADPD